MSSRTSKVIERMTAEKVPTKVFAFEFCHCVHESGFEVVSLHTTKAGAVKRMLAHRYAMAQDARDKYLAPGYRMYTRGENHYDHHYGLYKDWQVTEYAVVTP